MIRETIEALGLVGWLIVVALGVPVGIAIAVGVVLAGWAVKKWQGSKKATSK